MANLAKQKKANDLLVTALRTAWRQSEAGRAPARIRSLHGEKRWINRLPKTSGTGPAGRTIHEPLNTAQKPTSLYAGHDRKRHTSFRLSGQTSADDELRLIALAPCTYVCSTNRTTTLRPDKRPRSITCLLVLVLRAARGCGPSFSTYAVRSDESPRKN